VLSAAPRLYVGFLDDQAFRWESSRRVNFDRAMRQGATVIRTIVNWAFAAPREPWRPSDPFAPEYRLRDVDELVRNAEQRGMEVVLTIWGTPGWANAGRRPNVAPTDPNTLRDFAHALAERYSGRYTGYPFVRFYTVWNEPNAGRFLSPQFDARGHPVAPRTYAALADAAYEGIKSASPDALVGVGETAARGHDRPTKRVQDSESPARFARLVALAAPDLKFDAWAHHPYPRSDRAHPGAHQSWPAVGLVSLARFDAALGRWFGRPQIPLWITEFAYRTSPEIPGAAPYELQATYLERAVALARAQPRVGMLVWFIFRDARGEPWQSGLVDQYGQAKPALAKFAAASASSASELVVTADPAALVHSFRVPALELRSRVSAGARVATRYVITACDRLVTGGYWESRIGADGWVPVTAPVRLKPGATYTLSLSIEAVYGGSVERRVVLRAGAGAGVSGCPRP
jgi:hypothetical protein